MYLLFGWQGSAVMLKQMFCGLCSMSRVCPSPASWKFCRFPELGLQAGGAGAHPAKQRRETGCSGQKVSCGVRSGTEASPYAALGV